MNLPRVLSPAKSPNRLRHSAELGGWLGLYLLYILLRGLTIGGPEQARANADRIIALEDSIGLFHEPFLQQWFIAEAQLLVVWLNWVYIATYWPVILATALTLYSARYSTYCRYRNLIVAHLIISLGIFWAFPLLPPFKTGLLVDTIQVYGPSFYGSPAMAMFYNTNAAMPSLHFSWTCILAWLFIREGRGWYRYLSLGYPLLTLLAIVITGNHFFLDAVVGAALIGPAVGIVKGAAKIRSARWSHFKTIPL